MPKWLSITGAAVPWVATLMGMPIAPAVAGALSTAVAIGNSLPKRNRDDLASFVGRAEVLFDQQCRGEGSSLGEAERDLVGDWLMERLCAVESEVALGAALLGATQFKAIVGPPPAKWNSDYAGYLHALVVNVHGLVMTFAHSPEMLGAATLKALRMIVSDLNQRPTLDHVQAMIQQAVTRELALRRLIVGTRPALAPALQQRPQMAELEQAFARSDFASVCAVRGMRGLGKSQLAAAFAQQCVNDNWSFVGWIAADSRDQIVTELASAARMAGLADRDDSLDDAAHKLIVWLNGQDGNRLLVYDNVNDPADLRQFLPTGPGMKVLTTTTKHDTVLGEAIELDLFGLDQAVDYLVQRTSFQDRAGAALVANDLGRLPLALSQAAVAMTLLGRDYTGYRALLAQRPLNSALRREDGDSYPALVGDALNVAIRSVLDHLTSSSAELGPAAAVVLDQLSMLAESGVPREWLERAGDDDLVTSEAIGELLNRSVLTQSADRTVIVLHRLQSQVLREQHTDSSHATALTRASSVLNSVGLNDPNGFWTQRDTVAAVTGQLLAIRGQTHSRELLDDPTLLSVAHRTAHQANVLSDPTTAIALWSVPEKMEAWFSCREFVDVSVS